MKTTLSTAMVILFLMSIGTSACAFDLSLLNPFAQNSNQRSSSTGNSNRVFSDLSASQSSTNFNSLNVSYNSFSHNPANVVTPGVRRDGERFLLPSDSRIPDELRPLLTERLTPRQGLAMHGGTGAVLIPSPGILEPGKTAVGVHVQPFELRNINDATYTDRSYFDTTLNIAYGMDNGMEVSLDRTFSNQDRYDLEEPTYFNAKYQVPGNITLGSSLVVAGRGYHSAWIGAGVPVAWVAAGVNYGRDDYRFSFTPTHRGRERDKLARAKYGGYNYDYSKATGYADPLFFMVGGAVPVNDNLRFLYDFNGDKFSLGFRFNYLDSLYINASYISDGDYENLPGPIAHKKLKNFVFGATIVY